MHSQPDFHRELTHIITQQNLYTISSDGFVSKSMEVLERHAPLKQKYIRADQATFMTKELQKSIMLPSKLRNRLNKLKTRASKYGIQKTTKLMCLFIKKGKEGLL